MKRFIALFLCFMLFLPMTVSSETLPVDAAEEYEDDAGDESGVMLGEDDGELQESIEDDRELAFGDKGEDVSALQQKLASLHYYSGKVTGNYKEGTRAAVKAFQADFGLEQTGKADSTTLATLYSTAYRPLTYKSSGDDVKALQTRLKELGYYGGKVSGNYLDGTQKAVKAFQQANHEEATGVADVDTQTLLFSDDALSKKDAAARDEAEKYAPVESAVGTAFPRRLSKGSSGLEVKQVQQRLQEMGYYTGPISGNYQSKTTNAVKAFQKKNELDVNGVVGENTWNMLFNTEDVLLPQDTPRPTPEPTPPPYMVVVDVNNQVTIVYGLDENGEYTQVVREMLCSTGTKENPSDLGEFTLNGRHSKWCYFPKFDSYARYWTRINPSIAFHSVIYNEVDLMALSVSSYKHLGSRASHGCVRLTVADSKWVYENIGKGTKVIITDQLPADPELRASLKLPPLNKKTMTPETTPEPTAPPVYISSAQPPMPLTKLSKGDSSEAVYWLQCRLTELGYYHGKCSGTYLDGTANAVRAYKKDHGLKQNGTADEKMLEMLYADVLSPANN